MIVGCPQFVLKLQKFFIQIQLQGHCSQLLSQVCTLSCTQSSSIGFFRILKRDQIAYVQAEQATDANSMFLLTFNCGFLCKWDFSGSWLVLLLNEDMTFISNRYQRLLSCQSKSVLGVLRITEIWICYLAANLLNNQKISFFISVSFFSEER